MRKNKILILNYEFPPLWWWAANATYYLLKDFSKLSEYTFHLVTSSIDKYKFEQFDDWVFIHYLDIWKNMKWYHYQTYQDLLKYSYKALNYSKKLIWKNKYSLIHSFFGIPCGYLSMKLKKKYNIPYIVSLRWSDVPFYSKRFEKLDKYVFSDLSKKVWKDAEKVIANSQWLKDLANKTLPNFNIDIIENGIDLEEYDKIDIKTCSETLNLIFVWRLIERKWIIELIKAFSRFRKNYQEARLMIVWHWKLYSEVKMLIEADNISDSVELKWHIEHSFLPAIYKSQDLYILPSKNEGMSNTLIEAMASKLPVIVTDTWWTSELFCDNGWTIKWDSDSIYDSLILAYKEWKSWNLPALWEKSYQKIKDYSWESIAKKYLNVYDGIIKK